MADNAYNDNFNSQLATICPLSSASFVLCLMNYDEINKQVISRWWNHHKECQTMISSGDVRSQNNSYMQIMGSCILYNLNQSELTWHHVSELVTSRRSICLRANLTKRRSICLRANLTKCCRRVNVMTPSIDVSCTTHGSVCVSVSKTWTNDTSSSVGTPSMYTFANEWCHCGCRMMNTQSNKNIRLICILTRAINSWHYHCLCRTAVALRSTDTQLRETMKSGPEIIWQFGGTRWNLGQR